MPAPVPSIARSFSEEPWLITKEKGDQIAFLLACRHQGIHPTDDEVLALTGGSRRENGKLTESIGDTAVIHVAGIISPKLSPMQKISGGTSVAQLEKEFHAVMKDPDVRTVVLDIDSPGGSVLGCFECIDAMRSAKEQSGKKVYAIANHMAASAGYAIASVADELWVTKAGTVGSIGVYMEHYDLSERLKQQGVSHTFIYEGEYKVAGNEMEPLSEKGREVIVERVAHSYEMFVDAVAQNKSISPQQARAMANGKSYPGQIAVNAGYADRVGTFEQLMNHIHRSVASQGTLLADRSQNILASSGVSGSTLKEVKMRAAKKFLVNQDATRADWSDAQVKEYLTSKGMPEDTDASQAASWCLENLEWPTQAAVTQTATQVAGAVDADALAAALLPRMSDMIQQEVSKTTEKTNKLKSYASAMCAKQGFPDMVEKVLKGSESEADINQKVLDLMAEESQKVGPTIHFPRGGDAKDKHHDVLKAAVLCRFTEGTKLKDSVIEEMTSDSRKLVESAGMKYAKLTDLAKECCHLEGYDTSNMPNQQIAKLALGFGKQMGVRASFSGYHSTGSFAELTLDAMNKTMLRAYTEKPHSYQKIFRKARSASDFKTIHRIRLGEIPNIDEWDGRSRPNEVSFGDQRVEYAVRPHANLVTFDWVLIVNDDMDALSRMTVQYTQACARKLNAECIGRLTSNPVQPDGQTLFLASPAGNRKKPNQTTGVISVNSLGAARTMMRRMTGLNDPDGNESDATLGIAPRYLLIPATQETLADQQIHSIFDPSTSNDTQTKNPFRHLEPVCEPLLDLSSTLEWYLLADYNEIDTVEYTFLEGEETPIIEAEVDFDSKGIKHRIQQTFAAKDIEWRGMVKSTGA